MRNVLHLSDLHFGYDRDDTDRVQRTEALELLVREIQGLPAGWRPSILVISGDLTWQGKSSGYAQLAAWLANSLFPATDLKAQDCIICPGNHDIDREAAYCLPDRTQDANRADGLLRPERLSKGFAAPFKEFSNFASGLGIKPLLLNGQPNHLAGVVDLLGIRFVCVNSAWFCRDSDTDRGQLWLGLPQLQSMQIMNPGDYDRSPITVAVLHHPPEWLANAECVSYDNRPGSYSYLASRTHIILSGHTHGAVDRPTRCFDRARLFVGGATYDKHSYRNSFSVLNIDLNSRIVARRSWELDPRTPQWEQKDPQEYSLCVVSNQSRTEDPGKYLAWLREHTEWIDVRGLQVGVGKAYRFPIRDLYVPLTSLGVDLDAKTGLVAPPKLDESDEIRESALKDSRVVVIGDPGSGKTTYLRRLAFEACTAIATRAASSALFPILIRIGELEQHVASCQGRKEDGVPTTSESLIGLATSSAHRSGTLMRVTSMKKCTIPRQSSYWTGWTKRQV
jgi:hypothetical protein